MESMQEYRESKKSALASIPFELRKKDSFVVVFDIDGTLADCDHRRPHLYEDPKNWGAFNEKMHLDTLIEPISKLFFMLITLHEFGFKFIKVLIVSGRDEAHRQVTEEWLEKHKLIYDELYMRPKDDRRDDPEIKEEILHQIIEKYGQKPDLVFEDRSRVVKMWRSHGIVCAQVAEGDF